MSLDQTNFTVNASPEQLEAAAQQKLAHAQAEAARYKSAAEKKRSKTRAVVDHIKVHKAEYGGATAATSIAVAVIGFLSQFPNPNPPLPAPPVQSIVEVQVTKGEFEILNNDVKEMRHNLEREIDKLTAAVEQIKATRMTNSQLSSRFMDIKNTHARDTNILLEQIQRKKDK